MSPRDPQSSSLETEVRELVRRAVDNLLPSGSTASAEPSGSRAAERTIALGADHGGYRMKEMLAAWLRDAGWQVVDCGTDSEESVDYPDLALEVAQRVSRGVCRWGVVVDGAGIGSAMAANKVPGVRAALCYDLSSARNSREHNHANVLTLGAGLIGTGLARQIVETWLATPWGPDRHARRVEKIASIERRFSAQPSTCSCQH